MIREVKKFQFDIVALQEAKQVGQDKIEIEDALFFNSGNTNRILGTGFIAHNDLKASVVEFNPVSGHLYVLRLGGKYQKIKFVNIHARSEDKDIELKEDF